MSVRVVARIRPLLKNELDKDVIVTVDSTQAGGASNVVKIPSPKNPTEEFTFAFNSVYDQQTSQEELFTAESNYSSRLPDSGTLRPMLKKLICSRSSPKSPFSGTRSHILRLRRHRDRQDAHNARRP
jgi:hypothetical protein